MNAAYCMETQHGRSYPEFHLEKKIVARQHVGQGLQGMGFLALARQALATPQSFSSSPNRYRGRAHPPWRRLPPTMHTVPRIASPSPIAFNVLVGIRLGEQKGATASQTIALGRKNLLFAGSETAGQRDANIISLIQAAKAIGHEPHAYLRGVLTRLPTQLNSRIGELLPRAWQPTNA